MPLLPDHLVEELLRDVEQEVAGMPGFGAAQALSPEEAARLLAVDAPPTATTGTTASAAPAPAPAALTGAVGQGSARGSGALEGALQAGFAQGGTFHSPSIEEILSQVLSDMGLGSMPLSTGAGGLPPGGFTAAAPLVGFTGVVPEIAPPLGYATSAAMAQSQHGMGPVPVPLTLPSASAADRLQGSGFGGERQVASMSLPGLPFAGGAGGPLEELTAAGLPAEEIQALLMHAQQQAARGQGMGGPRGVGYVPELQPGLELGFDDVLALARTPEGPGEGPWMGDAGGMGDGAYNYGPYPGMPQQEGSVPWAAMHPSMHPAGTPRSLGVGDMGQREAGVLAWA